MNKTFSSQNRSHFITELKNGVDVLIIGGGINGAGIARDCAMRGLKTGLIEKNGFASGTSSRSSKLIHGGIRYLEHLDFPLVMESCGERALLLKKMPELIKPTPFLMPIYKTDRYGMFMMNMGMWLYDFLALMRNFKFHKKLSKNDVIKNSPDINREGLLGGFIYYDSRVNDSRLVINNIVSSVAFGATALNYIEAKKFIKTDGKITAVSAFDILGSEEFEIPCTTLISAAGPWTNEIYAKAEDNKKDLLRLTKGIHLLFPRKKCYTETAVVIMSNNDKRIIFIIPWEEYTLIGTTDTDYNSDINSVYPENSDVKYLLDLVNKKFPGFSLKPEDAISGFAGLRPLLLSKGNSGAISRRDKVIKGKSNTYYIGGGKLTTYRKISENVTSMVIQNSFKNKKLNSCQTATTPLIDFDSISDKGEMNSLIDKKVAEYLKRRYGNGYYKIEEIIQNDNRLANRIYKELPFVFAEIKYGIEHEMLMTIRDFYRYRTEIFLKSEDNGMSMLKKCVDIFGKELNLNNGEVLHQIESYKSFANKNLNCINRSWK